ncbi:nucleoside hydrolase-like domain-containing protein [Flavobacterium anhuiense]|uniref:nucleoside hydrolase-like domain-containing protein n=1 Tax=Flavobacterium anhuiense TaxID=459526 RepID=UPI003D962326
MRIYFYLLCFFSCSLAVYAQKPTPEKPRILISTDIGGTDPDDNQSMAHLLMYNEKFQIEGLVSSPSYGNGSKQEIIRMIDLYEKDLPKLQKHQTGFATPEYLRSISKQGYRGNVSYIGYSKATEGSDWIVKCAKKKSSQPLWILVWGGLEDLAQALHDAPEIQNKIKVYWIGGPNKKWSANSYAYIVANFPKLWFIENNSSYYGLFSHSDEPDSVVISNYYTQHIRDKSALGKDFINYYKGEVKMGDTPSLLYMMDGDPNDPTRESWGGSFEKFNYSPRTVLDRTTTIQDTVAYCSIMELRFKIPKTDAKKESIYFWMEVPYGKNIQKWPGYYIGNDVYAIRYIPKKAEVLNYKLTSDLSEINGKEGTIVATNLWPGKKSQTDYKLGNNWFTDKQDKDLYFGKIQGGKTVSKWKEEILVDWAKRWNWLNE